MRWGEVIARGERWAKTFATQDSGVHWYGYPWRPYGRDKWVRYNGKPPIKCTSPHYCIMEAFEVGKGITLSPQQVARLAYDDAVRTAATDDWDLYPEHEGLPEPGWLMRR